MPVTRGDVVAAIRARFPSSDVETVLAVRDLYGTEPYERERERVQLAIVALSQGAEDRLLHFVQAAKTDYRDVLSWHGGGPLTPEQGAREQEAARRVLDRWGKR